MLRHSRLLPLAAAFVAASAAAQSPFTSAPGAGQGSPAPSLSHRSPLAGYQPFTEENVIPWRQANDTVGRIGGWREYARESAPPAAAPAAPAAPAAGHGGHQH